MSQIKATIKAIENFKSLNIVSFDFNEIVLKMVSLDLNEDVKSGKKVMLNIKPTSVAIAKNLCGMLSYSNQIVSIIKDMEVGELLCSLKLLAGEDEFESIITTSSAKRMDLHIGDEITALIKANEISISEVLE